MLMLIYGICPRRHTAESRAQNSVTQVRSHGTNPRRHTPESCSPGVVTRHPPPPPHRGISYPRCGRTAPTPSATPRNPVIQVWSHGTHPRRHTPESCSTGVVTRRPRLPPHRGIASPRCGHMAPTANTSRNAGT